MLSRHEAARLKWLMRQRRLMEGRYDKKQAEINERIERLNEPLRQIEGDLQRVDMEIKALEFKLSDSVTITGGEDVGAPNEVGHGEA